MAMIAYLFSGQGAQALGMGQSLYKNSAAARRCFDEADELLDFDFKKACFEGPADLLTETRVCQPALYVHGYAIIAALREANKIGKIAGLAGLSLGELTAHAVAETYDFRTGLQLVAERGRGGAGESAGAAIRVSRPGAGGFSPAFVAARRRDGDDARTAVRAGPDRECSDARPHGDRVGQERP